MIERTIISNLIKNEDYVRKVLPNLKTEYFYPRTPERIAFEIIDEYVRKYSQLPAPEALGIELTNRKDLDHELFDATAEFFGGVVDDDSQVQIEWLIDQTEDFAKDRAINLALAKALEIVKDEGEKGISKGAIPKLFEDALAISFDPHIGHDYFEDREERYDSYNAKLKKYLFDLKYMNLITQDGLEPQTLNVIMAVAGAGKSLFMSHCAAAHVMMGYNVLYISLELAEKKVGQRIDANLLGVDMHMLRHMPKDLYLRRMSDIDSKTSGRLVFKEYAPSSAGASHFRYLINELRLKKGFVPDIIYIDYLNICAPTSRKGDMNSYERVKVVAEELRGIGVDLNVPIVTATQTNRGGYGSGDVDMENVADSMGLPMTADLLIALIQTDELKQLGQYKIKQLKSRYDDMGRIPTFILGVDKPKMRLFDVEDSAQNIYNGPAMPAMNMGSTPFGGLNLSGFK